MLSRLINKLLLYVTCNKLISESRIMPHTKKKFKDSQNRSRIEAFSKYKAAVQFFS